jgi:hypothetical protein
MLFDSNPHRMIEVVTRGHTPHTPTPGNFRKTRSGTGGPPSGRCGSAAGQISGSVLLLRPLPSAGKDLPKATELIRTTAPDDLSTDAHKETIQ